MNKNKYAEITHYINHLEIDLTIDNTITREAYSQYTENYSKDIGSGTITEHFDV